MTREQRALVQRSADAALTASRFADHFYETLFRLAPETRPLFSSDLSALKLKFTNTLASIVGAVERPDMFSSILMHLGRQHRRFGVVAAHYVPVGTALMATLSQILGEGFTPEVHAAWEALYTEIAQQMQEGAKAD